MSEVCGWCGRKLPEAGFDAWLVCADKVGVEKPCCTACAKRYKPLVVRIEKS